jgi:hypothetical protein
MERKVEEPCEDLDGKILGLREGSLTLGLASAVAVRCDHAARRADLGASCLHATSSLHSNEYVPTSGTSLETATRLPRHGASVHAPFRGRVTRPRGRSSGTREVSTAVSGPWVTKIARSAPQRDNSPAQRSRRRVVVSADPQIYGHYTLITQKILELKC